MPTGLKFVAAAIRLVLHGSYCRFRIVYICCTSNRTRAESMGFKYRILVVDDDAGIRQVSQLLVTSKGYEVQTAENGFDALVMLRESLPDIIVSDLKMRVCLPSCAGDITRRRSYL
jgi:hypothetical protein